MIPKSNKKYIMVLFEFKNQVALRIRRPEAPFLSSKGGITLFLAIVFMALLVLTGIFIDAARIMVAERKVQSSLNTAARSVLSQYDEELLGQFGIFGLETKTKVADIRSQFIKYFNINMVERHKGLRLINYEAGEDCISISTMGSLLSNDIYERQLLEYMKYKAPLTITENIINKFKKLSLGEKLEFADKEAKARLIGGNIKKSIRSFNSTVKEIGKAVGISIINDLKVRLKDAVNENFNDSIRMLGALKQKHDMAKGYLNSLDKPLEDYYTAKKDVIEAAEKAKAVPTKNEFTDTKASKEAVLNVLNGNIGKIDQLIGKISSVGSEINNLKLQLDALKKQKLQDEDRIKSLEDEITRKSSLLNCEIDNFKPDDINELNIEEDCPVPPHDNDKENRKGFFGELKGIITEKFLLKSIKATGGLIEEDEYIKASEEDRREFGALCDGFVDNFNDGDIAEEQNKNILAFMKRLLELIKDTAKDSWDNMFITEYIMDKYTFTTSRTVRDHYFDRAEVEYILCGQDIEAENAGLILGSTWFLRFGINTIDYFAASKIPHPGARIIWAMIEGATRAFKDIYELYTTKNGCSICPSFPNIKVSYSDHLRLFLMLKSKEIKLKRMRQLLQVDLMKENKDFRIGNCDTWLKATAEVKVNLFFIPLLQLDKLKPEHFKNGRYVIKKEIMTGY